MKKILLSIVAVLFLSSAALAQNTIVMETSKGTVKIELQPDLAPAHVERIKTLTSQGFYNGVVFHRVIPGFMAQTGDPTGTGMGGSELPDLKAEVTNTPFTRGTLGMARTSDPNTANSQFFITYDRAEWLDGQYTVFGRVIEGMDVIDRLNKGTRANNGAVDNPDRIVEMRVE